MSEVDDRHLALAQKCLAGLSYNRSTRATAHLGLWLVLLSVEMRFLSLSLSILSLGQFPSSVRSFGCSRNFVSCPRSFFLLRSLASSRFLFSFFPFSFGCRPFLSFLLFFPSFSLIFSLVRDRAVRSSSTTDILGRKIRELHIVRACTLTTHHVQTQPPE